jgi:hypothetical protein
MVLCPCERRWSIKIGTLSGRTLDALCSVNIVRRAGTPIFLRSVCRSRALVFLGSAVWKRSVKPIVMVSPSHMSAVAGRTAILRHHCCRVRTVSLSPSCCAARAPWHHAVLHCALLAPGMDFSMTSRKRLSKVARVLRRPPVIQKADRRPGSLLLQWRK